MDIEIILKILLSALLGGILGLEREISHREAGLRTTILIAVGSTLLTVLALKLAVETKSPVPTGIIGHIVTGMAIIGAGVVIREKFVLRGLTTAAAILIASAVGIGVGSGYYLLSFLVAIVVVIILVVFKQISKALEHHKKIYAYIIKTEDKAGILIEVKKVIKDLGISYVEAKLAKRKDGFDVEVLLSTSQNKNREFIEKVMLLQGVLELTGESL